MNHQALSSFIWSVADLLRGDYRQSEYGKVILPFTVLRRLDCVLEATKPEVLAEFEAKAKAGLNPDPFLLRKAGQSFYNISPLDLGKVLGDQDHIRENLYAYIQGFSPAARDIFERFEFVPQVERLAKAGLLYLVTEKFANIDVHPDTVDNAQMGLVFEELIRKFAEISNETAGEHFTPREVIRLMVNTRELVGSAAVTFRDYPRLMLCDKLYRLRLRPDACAPFFLALYLGTPQVRGQIELSATGASSSMLNIGQSTILELDVAVPSPNEQTTITSFLDRETGKIDALIAEQEKLLALLAEKRLATISHAVTKGLNPDAPMKDSGAAWLGEVPGHWRVSPLKYLVTFSSGGTPSKENLDYWDGNLPWASAKDMKMETLHDTADHITQLAVDNRAASLLPAGTVLVVVRGMILARIFPVTQIAVPMAINQDLKGLQPTEALDSNYLAWLLRGSADESLQRLDEAGHGTKALRMDAWSSMQLPVPPRDEQIEIASFLDAETTKLDNLKSESERAITLLKERRSALIAAAVTGKIDVRQA